MSDEIERRPAGENPWYVLMTIHSEEALPISKDHNRNRRFWHAWIGTKAKSEEIDAHCRRTGIARDEFKPLSVLEKMDWEDAVSARIVQPLPDPCAVVEFKEVEFSRRLNCREFFIGTAHFDYAKFAAGADFTETTFMEYCRMINVQCHAYMNFSEVYFRDEANLCARGFAAM